MESAPYRARGWAEGGRIGGGALTGIGGAVIVFALYFVCGLAVARFFAVFGLFPAPIWLPSSIALAGVIMLGWRAFPAIAAASFLVNFRLFDSTLWVATAISLGNAAGPVLGAMLLVRWCRGQAEFARLHSLFGFILFGVAAHAGVTASVGTATLHLLKGVPSEALADIWVNWWVSDAGGSLYFAPALLLWFEAPRPAATRAALIEGVIVSAATLAATIAIFTSGPFQFFLRSEAAYLLVLPLAWLTLRLSLRSAYTLFTIVVIIATAGTVAGEGPFNIGGFEKPLTALGAMLVLFSINTLLVAALVREQSAARAESEAKSDFFANVSHELRTPLNAIIGFAEAIETGVLGADPDSRRREYARIIRQSGNHLLSLIDDLLDLARLQSGNRDVDMRPVSLGECFSDARAVVEHMAMTRGVRIETTGQEPPPAVQADPRAMRQILINLLSNAVKFTPEGGRVQLSAEGEDGHVLISVADDGIGMSQEDVGVALEPFGRVRRSDARREEGTGLGLPIAIGLVESLGGTLSIESRSGRGTTVLIRLPAPPG